MASIFDKNNTEEKQLQLLEFREEMTNLKLKVLNSQLNPHFMFNALNAIQYFVTTNKKSKTLKYLSGFSKLIRFYLKHINKNASSLEDEIEALTWYLKLQKLRHNSQLDYKISGPYPTKFKHIKVPSFIIQTLIENLVEESIYRQRLNQNFSIKFKILNNKIELSIKSTYKKNNLTLNRPIPEYRNSILKWQDQIDLLNRVMNYKIEKEVLDIQEEHINGSHIFLRIPILIAE